MDSSQDFLDQSEAGHGHTNSWRGAEASAGLVWLLTKVKGLFAYISSIHKVLPGQQGPDMSRGPAVGTPMGSGSRLYGSAMESTPVLLCRQSLPVQLVFTVGFCLGWGSGTLVVGSWGTHGPGPLIAKLVCRPQIHRG